MKKKITMKLSPAIGNPLRFKKFTGGVLVSDSNETEVEWITSNTVVTAEVTRRDDTPAVPCTITGSVGHFTDSNNPEPEELNVRFYPVGTEGWGNVPPDRQFFVPITGSLESIDDLCNIKKRGLLEKSNLVTIERRC